LSLEGRCALSKILLPAKFRLARFCLKQPRDWLGPWSLINRPNTLSIVTMTHEKMHWVMFRAKRTNRQTNTCKMKHIVSSEVSIASNVPPPPPTTCFPPKKHFVLCEANPEPSRWCVLAVERSFLLSWAVAAAKGDADSRHGQSGTNGTPWIVNIAAIAIFNHARTCACACTCLGGST
jgi:hypothetical protein